MSVATAPTAKRPGAHRTCVVCAGSAIEIGAYSRERILRDLESVTGGKPAGALEVADYALLRCRACGLEFAEPMREPGSAFYVWLIDADVRYPEDRWEWRACADLLRERVQRTGNPARVVDVGCGDGRFLRILQGVPGVSAVGLDLNPNVVKACRARGLVAIEGSLGTVSASLPERIDMVTLWHVVEHVADPVGVLRLAASLLVDGGSICFSVPLTPMSYEHAWPDPLNAPPHHLSRWCISALEALAKSVGMPMRLVLPEAESYGRRVLRALALQAMPPFGGLDRAAKAKRLVRFVLRHPALAAIELWRQARLSRYRGRVLPDVVLVCLHREPTKG